MRRENMIGAESIRSAPGGQRCSHVSWIMLWKITWISFRSVPLSPGMRPCFGLGSAI